MLSSPRRSLSTIKSARLLTIIGLLAFSGLTVLSAVPTASAAKPIGCGVTIQTSVTLTSDLGPCPGNGIVIGINADNVVLNCAGHTISGEGSYRGVFAKNGYVTVENCNVKGFEYGYSLKGGTFTGDTASSNTYGFYGTIFGLTLDDDSANRNTIGYTFTFSPDAYGSSLTGNTANENTGDGFTLYHLSNGHLSGNTASSNGADGFYFGGNQITITGNMADSNKGYGFDVSPVHSSLKSDIISLNECSGNLLGGSSPTGLCTPQP